MSDTAVDLMQKQRELEATSVGLGIDRYRQERPMPWAKDDPKRREETELAPGRALLMRSIEPLTEAINATLDRALSGRAGKAHTSMRFLQDIDPKVCAYVCARRALNGASAGDSLQSIAIGIGSLLEEHVMFESFAKEEPGLYNYFQRQANKSTTARYKRARLRGGVKAAERNGSDIKHIEWTELEKLRVGEKLLDLFIRTCGLVELGRNTIAKNRTQVVLKPTDACAEWLEKQHARCEMLSPLHLPMVVKPDDWTTPYDGGYLNKKMNRLDMVKTRNRGYKDELMGIDMPEVYSALNAIQAVPWRINKRVLNVMREVWDSGATLGDLPPREDLPLPPRPEDIDTNEISRKHWKGAAAKVHEDNAKLRSKRLAMSQKVWMAESFKDFEQIYFPHQLDFRGRVYPAVPFMNPQADDTGKALLELANGKPLGEEGEFWLKVHIANLFGVDKVSFPERVQWVEENLDALMDSAKDPLDGERFWSTADDPYCALAAIFDLADYLADPANHVSHIAVAMDGSCSGLQHFSAMLRDEIGGKAVNLIPSEKPQDIYTEVANKAEEIVMDASDKGDAMAALWEGKISRKIAKRPCMTLSYGATRFGFQEQINGELKKLDQTGEEYLPGADNYDAAKYMSYVINDAIAAVVVAARNAMDWLQATARVAAKEGLPVHWTSPVGFPVLQEYRQTTSKTIDLYFGGQRAQLKLATETLKLNKRRQANGISPNFIHSLDASHLMMTVNMCVERGITDFAFIHDSYGTHACDVGLLSRTLREAFVKQYTPDVLEEFRQEIMSQLPGEFAEEVPEIPPKGKLNLDQVVDSDYFFA